MNTTYLSSNGATPLFSDYGSSENGNNAQTASPTKETKVHVANLYEIDSNMVEAKLPPELPEINREWILNTIEQGVKKGDMHSHIKAHARENLDKACQIRAIFMKTREAARKSIGEKLRQRWAQLSYLQKERQNLEAGMMEKRNQYHTSKGLFDSKTSRFAVVCEPNAEALHEAAYEKEGCSTNTLKSAQAAFRQAQDELNAWKPLSFASHRYVNTATDPLDGTSSTSTFVPDSVNQSKGSSTNTIHTQVLREQPTKNSIGKVVALLTCGILFSFTLGGLTGLIEWSQLGTVESLPRLAIVLPVGIGILALTGQFAANTIREVARRTVRNQKLSIPVLVALAALFILLLGESLAEMVALHGYLSAQDSLMGTGGSSTMTGSLLWLVCYLIGLMVVGPYTWYRASEVYCEESRLYEQQQEESLNQERASKQVLANSENRHRQQLQEELRNKEEEELRREHHEKDRQFLENECKRREMIVSDLLARRRRVDEWFSQTDAVVEALGQIPEVNSRLKAVNHSEDRLTEIAQEEASLQKSPIEMNEMDRDRLEALRQQFEREFETLFVALGGGFREGYEKQRLINHFNTVALPNQN